MNENSEIKEYVEEKGIVYGNEKLFYSEEIMELIDLAEKNDVGIDGIEIYFTFLEKRMPSYNRDLDLAEVNDDLEYSESRNYILREQEAGISDDIFKVINERYSISSKDKVKKMYIIYFYEKIVK